MANDFMKEVDERFIVKDSNFENVYYDIDVSSLWGYVWQSDSYSIKIKEILTRYLRTNNILHNLPVSDVQDAGNGTTNNGRVQRVPISTQDDIYLTDQTLQDIEPVHYPPHEHLEGTNITQICDISNDNVRAVGYGRSQNGNIVQANCPFDNRLLFHGIVEDFLSDSPSIDDFGDELDTFNCLLDNRTPTGYANDFLNTYRRYVSVLVTANGHDTQSNAQADTQELLNTGEDIPTFVGETDDCLKLWRDICSTKTIWSTDKHSLQPKEEWDDASNQSGVHIEVESKKIEQMDVITGEKKPDGTTTVKYDAPVARASPVKKHTDINTSELFANLEQPGVSKSKLEHSQTHTRQKTPEWLKRCKIQFEQTKADTTTEDARSNTADASKSKEGSAMKRKADEDVQLSLLTDIAESVTKENTNYRKIPHPVVTEKETNMKQSTAPQECIPVVEAKERLPYKKPTMTAGEATGHAAPRGLLPTPAHEVNITASIGKCAKSKKLSVSASNEDITDSTTIPVRVTYARKAQHDSHKRQTVVVIETQSETQLNTSLPCNTSMFWSHQQSQGKQQNQLPSSQTKQILHRQHHMDLEQQTEHQQAQSPQQQQHQKQQDLDKQQQKLSKQQHATKQNQIQHQPNQSTTIPQQQQYKQEQCLIQKQKQAQPPQRQQLHQDEKNLTRQQNQQPPKQQQKVHYMGKHQNQQTQPPQQQQHQQEQCLSQQQKQQPPQTQQHLQDQCLGRQQKQQTEPPQQLQKQPQLTLQKQEQCKKMKMQNPLHKQLLQHPQTQLRQPQQHQQEHCLNQQKQRSTEMCKNQTQQQQSQQTQLPHHHKQEQPLENQQHHLQQPKTSHQQKIQSLNQQQQQHLDDQKPQQIVSIPQQQQQRHQHQNGMDQHQLQGRQQCSHQQQQHSNQQPKHQHQQLKEHAQYNHQHKDQVQQQPQQHHLQREQHPAQQHHLQIKQPVQQPIFPQHQQPPSHQCPPKQSPCTLPTHCQGLRPQVPSHFFLIPEPQAALPPNSSNPFMTNRIQTVPVMFPEYVMPTMLRPASQSLFNHINQNIQQQINLRHHHPPPVIHQPHQHQGHQLTAAVPGINQHFQGEPMPQGIAGAHAETCMTAVPQGSKMRLDDEVWYFNGQPHQHVRETSMSGVQHVPLNNSGHSEVVTSHNGIAYQPWPAETPNRIILVPQPPVPVAQDPVSTAAHRNLPVCIGQAFYTGGVAGQNANNNYNDDYEDDDTVSVERIHGDTGHGISEQDESSRDDCVGLAASELLGDLDHLMLKMSTLSLQDSDRSLTPSDSLPKCNRKRSLNGSQRLQSPTTESSGVTKDSDRAGRMIPVVSSKRATGRGARKTRERSSRSLVKIEMS